MQRRNLAVVPSNALTASPILPPICQPRRYPNTMHATHHDCLPVPLCELHMLSPSGLHAMHAASGPAPLALRDGSYSRILALLITFNLHALCNNHFLGSPTLIGRT